MVNALILRTVGSIERRLVNPELIVPAERAEIDVAPSPQQVLDARVVEEHLGNIIAGNGEVTTEERESARLYVVAQNDVARKVAEATGELGVAQQTFLGRQGLITVAKGVHREVERRTPGVLTLGQVIGGLEAHAATIPGQVLDQEKKAALAVALPIIVIQAAKELRTINSGSPDEITTYEQAKAELQKAGTDGDIRLAISYAFSTLQGNEQVFNSLTEGEFSKVTIARFTDNVIKNAGIERDEVTNARRKEEYLAAQGAALAQLDKSFYDYLLVASKILGSSRPKLTEEQGKIAAKEYFKLVSRDEVVFNENTTSQALAAQYGGIVIPKTADEFADFVVALLKEKKGLFAPPASAEPAAVS